ncbi:MAG: serine/threonine-protein phosphatase [Phycisphaerales bacterium]|nr:serine/threonine-protein phosphatase [Phycisphaerales bacterium]
MSVRSRSNTDPRLADPVYLAQFEAERAGVLRRRMVWCLYILLALLGVSFLGGYNTYLDYTAGRVSAPSLVFLLVQDIALTALTIAALVYLLADRPDRRRLVRGITAFTIVALAIAVYFETRENLIDPNARTADDGGGAADPRVVAMRMALYSMLMLVWLPLVLIPMRLAESVRIVIGCAAVYAIIVLTVAGPPAGAWAAHAAAAILVPLVPMAYSHWRYLRFDAQFQHKDLAGRFEELSAELMQARKLHEALFPAPVTDGPVRFAYAYEPMREIGGDFLFVHPAEPTAHDRARFMVLVDVSGHGVAAALAVHRLHDELRRVFAAVDGPSHEQGGAAEERSVRDIIADLNRYVHVALAPQAVFATAMCVRIGPTGAGGWNIDWCNAGHPPSALRSGETGGDRATIRWLEPTATMLGVLEPDLYDPASRSMAMVAGDRLVAFTDGLIETRDGRGEMFGIERVRDTIARAAGRLGPGALCDALILAAAAHRAGRATDDVLVVDVEVGIADRPDARFETRPEQREPVTTRDRSRRNRG